MVRSLLVVMALVLASCSSSDARDGEPAAVISAPPATTSTPDTPVTTAVSAAEAVPTTTSASTTTVPPTTTETPRRRIVIHATGDVNVDPNYITAFRTLGYDHAWSGLNGLFVGDDLTIVNLECPVSDRGSPLPKEFTFRCDPEALPAMVGAGVDVANLGNNHSRDYGPQAMLDSIDLLEAAGIHPVGVGKDAAAANEAAILDIGGWRVAVVGFGGVRPGDDWIAGDNHPGMADGDTIETMVAAVAAAAEQADIVIVTIHWGVELDTTPRPEDVARAKAMIDAGADMIFGHHAHRLQPLEWVDGQPVAWGLGNFVWPRFSPLGATTAVAEVVVEADGTMSACLLPVIIESDGHPVLVDDYVEPCAAE